MSDLSIDRNQEPIFGVNVGICALHNGRRGPRGFWRASAGCACPGCTMLIGARQDVMCNFAVGGKK